MRGQSLYLREVLAAASGAHPLLVYNVDKGRCSTRLLAVNAEFFIYLMALRKLNFVVAQHMQQLNHTERLSRTHAFTTFIRESLTPKKCFATTKSIPQGGQESKIHNKHIQKNKQKYNKLAKKRITKCNRTNLIQSNNDQNTN